MRRRRGHCYRSGQGRRNRAQRRRLMLTFALVFGVVAGGGRAVHARQVPFGFPPVIDATGSHINSVSSADINGDGITDVISGSGDRIVWYENDGTPAPIWGTH